MTAVFEDVCPLCGDDRMRPLLPVIAGMRQAGSSAETIWKSLNKRVPRRHIEQHVQHVPRGAATAVAEAADAGQAVPVGWLERQGVSMPAEGDGVSFVAATVEVKDGDRRHWVRVKPETADVEEDRIEIRQAQPVIVQGTEPLYSAPSDRWQTWIATPDAQIGYWLGSDGEWHTTHDERAFDLAHQIAAAVAEDDSLHGWIDPGDFADLAAPSRHNPTALDLHVEGLNRTWQRGCEEWARRRWAVGETGEVVILEGNHDLRLKKRAAQEMPYLVGMRRAGDPGDEHPVLSVPYLMRCRDYRVEWIPGFPSTYRRLNGNLAVFHSPAYGSKALDTARKLAARIHMSVYHGHTHRREALAENIEGRRGNRTFEVWSDGTFGRTDGGLPSQRNAFDDAMGRMTVDDLPDDVGMLSEQFHQGMSIIHVERGGSERFSVERVAFWDGWAQWRGRTFEAGCDRDGRRLS